MQTKKDQLNRGRGQEDKSQPIGGDRKESKQWVWIIEGSNGDRKRSRMGGVFLVDIKLRQNLYMPNTNSVLPLRLQGIFLEDTKLRQDLS